MEQVKFYLRRYVFIQNIGDLIRLGDNENVITFDNNSYNKALIDKLIYVGVNSEDLYKEPLYVKIKTYNFLNTKNEDKYLDRGNLFFQFLNTPLLTDVEFATPILVFGAGAAGSIISYLLAQYGFKNITIVDDDIVNDSDVRKTMIYRKYNIGEKKIVALKNIVELNFGVYLKTVDKRLFDKHDVKSVVEASSPKLIINAIDPNPIHRIYLNELCYEMLIPYVVMGYSYKKIVCGPFIVPNITSCYESLNDILMKNSDGVNDLKKIEHLYTDYLIHPSISFNINILGNLIFKDILFFMANKLDYVSTLGKVLYFNPLEMDGEMIVLDCPIECHVCHGMKASDIEL